MTPPPITTTRARAGSGAAQRSVFLDAALAVAVPDAAPAVSVIPDAVPRAPGSPAVAVPDAAPLTTRAP
ncbi:MAG: hypothetical protein ACRCZP_12830 [Phycicoccus sp.]